MKPLTPLLLAAALAACSSTPEPEPTRMTNMAAQAFDRMDRDSNGVVTAAERDDARRAQFRRLDTDASGYLSAAELDAMQDAFGGDRPRRRGRRGGQADPLARMDRNADGRIGPDEFRGMGDALLQRADFDGDGNLSRDELDEALLRLQQRRQR